MSTAHGYSYNEPDEPARFAIWAKNAGLNVTQKGSASAIPSSHPVQKRRPLGLALVDAKDDPPKDHAPLDEPFSFATGKSQQELAAGMSVGSALGLGDALFTIIRELTDSMTDEICTMRDRIDRRIDDLKAAHRIELAEAKAATAELRSELSQIRSIQEAARIASRGESGLPGPRGIPGPAGVGQVGPQGPRGRTGAPAKIAAWVPDVDQFQLAPTYADGDRGAPLNLRPFFEAFNNAINTEDEG
jgi:hypothetical protein